MQYLHNNIGCGANLKVEIEHAEKATITYCVDEKAQKYETFPILIME